jgi:hypothetical protein
MSISAGARSGGARTIMGRGAVLTILALLEIGLLDRSYTFRRAVSGDPSPRWRL